VFSHNTVLLSIQSWDYAHRYGRDQFANVVNENVLEAIDDAQHDLADQSEAQQEERKWKHLCLKFPDEVELSSRVVNADAGEDDCLKLELIPIKVVHLKLTGVQCTMMHTAWKVARTDVKARKKRKQKRKTTRVMLLVFLTC